MTGSRPSWRRRLLRPVVAVPVALVAGGGVWWALRSTGSAASAQQVSERIVSVTSGPLRQTVSASGTVAPADVEDLSFTVGGKVTAVNVRAGQQVAKGAVLATIDSASLQSQVAQAQSSVDSATARVANDQSTSASSAQLNADEASLTSAEAQLASARSALAGATLTSPIDGTVSLVNLTAGQQLGSSGGSGVGLTGSATGSGRSSSASSGSSAASSGSSSAQIEVVSTGTLVVNLNVDDTEIGRLAIGQKATVVPAAVGATTRTGGGRGGANAAGASTTTTVASGAGQGAAAAGRVPTATGTVTSVSTIATSTSGVATFPVVVTLDGTPTGFFAGSTAQVAITYNELPDVVQVPLAAVTRSNGQAYVTVVDGTKRSRRAITIGITSGGVAQVTDGLQPDEQVVVTVPVATSNRATTGGTGGTGGTRTGGFPGGGGGFPGGGGGGGGLRGGPND